MPVITQNMEHYQQYDEKKGRRGGGSPLLLRCGLVCGNGNVRGPVQGAVTRSGMTSFVRRR